MRILITGADGQLGTALQKIASDFGIAVAACGHDDVNITNREHITAVLERERPEAVINCVAYNQVEAADKNVEAALALNAIGPYYLALACRELAIPLVHVSTDYVFPGIKNNYVETDTPEPINVYGMTKYTGERLVMIAHPNSYIVRTSWLFGPSKENKTRNFVTTMLRLGREKGNVRVVNDQTGSPTYAPDLATAIYRLLVRRAPAGIYHLTNSGVCTWYEFAQEIFKQAGQKVVVEPISTAQSGTVIARPAHSVLANERWAQLSEAPLRAWPEALQEYLQNLSFRTK